MALPSPLRLFLVIFSLALCRPADAVEPRVSYAVYVTPQLAPEIMHRAWTPLLDAVSRETGIGLSLTIPPSIAALEALILRGLPDLAFVNPYIVLPAYKAHGYVPLIRNGKSKLIGEILVRKDSPIKTLKDLDGARIAFPAPNAFAASLYPRAQLAREKIAFTPVYVGTHTNVYRHVLFGEVAAGGGVNMSLEREPESVRDMLRSVYTTPPLMPHPLVAHPRVPAATREAIAAAMLKLAARTENRTLFEASQVPEPVRADYKRDYAPMEALGLERFFVLGAD